MPNQLVIADTSCLIALKNINRLDLLKHIYSEIIITPEVRDEFGEEIPPWIKINEVRDSLGKSVIEVELDKGEASAIALALEMAESLLVIDEKKGRTYAQRLGIRIIGTLGIIVKAKEKGVFEKVKPILEDLERTGFRISQDLKENILKKVGEG